MNRNLVYSVKCPHCKKSEVRSDSKGQMINSYICWKCRNAFSIDWSTLTAISIKKTKKYDGSH